MAITVLALSPQRQSLGPRIDRRTLYFLLDFIGSGGQVTTFVNTWIFYVRPSPPALGLSSAECWSTATTEDKIKDKIFFISSGQTLNSSWRQSHDRDRQLFIKLRY